MYLVYLMLRAIRALLYIGDQCRKSLLLLYCVLGGRTTLYSDAEIPTEYICSMGRGGKINSKKELLFDTGAMASVVDDINLLFDIEPCLVRIVSYDGSSYICKQKGKLALRADSYNKQGPPIVFIVSNVYPIPTAHRNIISWKVLNSCNCGLELGAIDRLTLPNGAQIHIWYDNQGLTIIRAHQIGTYESLNNVVPIIDHVHTVSYTHLTLPTTD